MALSRRKVDVRFAERFHVPSSETVIGEFECKAMSVSVARRSSKSSNAAALDAAFKSAEVGYDMNSNFMKKKKKNKLISFFFTKNLLLQK